MTTQSCRRMTAVLALLFSFVVLPVARAEWKIKSVETTPGSAGGVEYRRYSLGDSGSDRTAEMRLTFFSAEKVNLRVIDQPGSDRRTRRGYGSGRFRCRA